MPASLRRQPAIDAQLCSKMQPWSVQAEDAAVLAWRKVKGLTPEIARQEPRIIADMIEYLNELRGTPSPAPFA